jgi:hypothetical protein
MKNSVMLKVFALLAFIPTYSIAQETEQNIELNTIEIRVSKDKVPSKVKDAVTRDFGEGTPLVWATTSSKFNSFGWEQLKDVKNQNVDAYSVHIKGKNGSALVAIYATDGKLIRSKETIKGMATPPIILASLAKSDYKDWKVSEENTVIKTYSGTNNEHYAIKMEKGKQKKMLYFDKNGNIVSNMRK